MNSKSIIHYNYLANCFYRFHSIRKKEFWRWRCFLEIASSQNLGRKWLRKIMLLNLRCFYMLYIDIFFQEEIYLWDYTYVDMRYFDRKFHHYSLYSEETSRRNVSFFSSATLLFFFLFSFFFSFFHYFLEIDFSFFDKIERLVLIPAIPNHLILHPVAHLTFRIIRPSFFSYIK